MTSPPKTPMHVAQYDVIMPTLNRQHRRRPQKIIIKPLPVDLCNSILLNNKNKIATKIEQEKQRIWSFLQNTFKLKECTNKHLNFYSDDTAAYEELACLLLIKSKKMRSLFIKFMHNKQLKDLTRKLNIYRAKNNKHKLQKLIKKEINQLIYRRQIFTT
eukprot:211907_1